MSSSPESTWKKYKICMEPSRAPLFCLSLLTSDSFLYRKDG